MTELNIYAHFCKVINKWINNPTWMTGIEQKLQLSRIWRISDFRLCPAVLLLLTFLLSPLPPSKNKSDQIQTCECEYDASVCLRIRAGVRKRMSCGLRWQPRSSGLHLHSLRLSRWEGSTVPQTQSLWKSHWNQGIVSGQYGSWYMQLIHIFWSVLSTHAAS